MSQAHPQHQAPLHSEVELTIFGPGIGESTCLHIGNGKWIIIDSTIDRASRKPIALLYLQSLGVNLEEDVVLIVVTHWHMDHIRGICDIVDACPSASVATSDAVSKPDFISFVKIASEIKTLNKLKLGEYDSLMTYLLNKSQIHRWKRVTEDYILLKYQYTVNSTPIEVTVTSVSPSQFRCNSIYANLTNWLTNSSLRSSKNLPFNRNDSSIALFIEIGPVALLLGADLEEEGTRGWSTALNSSLLSSAKRIVSIFKVPHHGSQNAHHEPVWLKLLLENCFALITPYSSSSLPRARDLKRLLGLTQNVFVTCIPVRRKPKLQNRIKKTAQKHTRVIFEPTINEGFVSLRKNILDNASGFEVSECHENIVQVKGTTPDLETVD